MKLSPKQKNYLSITGLTLGIFILTYTALLIIGFAPKQFESTQSENIKNIFQTSDGDFKNIPVLPVDTNLIPSKIEIPKIGVSSIIQTPKSIDVAALDLALGKGATYYPGSGTLQEGNLFLFGHSTNWKVVNNQAYKTFNDLDKLVKGDSVELTSNGKKYIYEVTSVRHAADDDVFVDFSKGNRMLTISTCDTFGQKQDRWVVEANFKEVL